MDGQDCRAVDTHAAVSRKTEPGKRYGYQSAAALLWTGGLLRGGGVGGAIQSAKDEWENNGTTGKSTQNQERVISQSQILMVMLINYVYQDVLIPSFSSHWYFGFSVSLPAASKSLLERREGP